MAVGSTSYDDTGSVKYDDRVWMNTASKYLTNPHLHEMPGPHPDPRHEEWNSGRDKSYETLKSIVI